MKAIHMLLDSGRLPQAEALIRESLATDPHNLDLRGCLVRYLLIKQNYTAAWKEVENVLMVDPLHYATRVYGVSVLRRLGRHASAIELCQQLLREAPRSAHLHAMMGTIKWFDMHLPQKKVQPHLAEALRLEPLNILSRVVRFSMAHAKRNSAEMRAIVEDLQRNFPGKKESAMLLSEFIALVNPADYRTIQDLIALYPNEPLLRKWAIRSKVLSLPIMRPGAWLFYKLWKWNFFGRGFVPVFKRVSVLVVIIALTPVPIAKNTSLGVILMLLFFLTGIFLIAWGVAVRLLVRFYEHRGI